MEILIKGPIISDDEQRAYDYFEINATSPNKVNAQLADAVSKNITKLVVKINSGGGSVFSASEIYTALKAFKGEVKVQIVGVAASAASVIAMAGTKVSMSPTAQLMIHNASMKAQGDYRTMDDTSEFLKNTNSTIINAYKIKTGKSEAELRAMMDKTTWMTPQQAKEQGFIDEILFEKELGAIANVDTTNDVLPVAVIEKVRSLILHKSATNTTNSKPIIPSDKDNESEMCPAAILTTPIQQPSEAEGQQAIEMLKAQKELFALGINPIGMTKEQLEAEVEAQGLINIFQTSMTNKDNENEMYPAAILTATIQQPSEAEIETQELINIFQGYEQ